MPEYFDSGPPYSPMAVANTFLRFAWAENKSIDPLKMQKLVYLAHGLHLAYREKPLIYEQVQAWESGLAIPSLYHEFKRYGYHPIDKYGEEPAGGDPIPKVWCSETLRFLENVWKVYGKYDALELSQISHASDGPWAEYKYGDFKHIIIDDSKIKAYFKSKISNNS